MYKTTVDLNQYHPITTNQAINDLEGRLAKDGEKIFSKDFSDQDRLTHALDEIEKMEGLGLPYSNIDFDLEKVPNEFKYCTTYIRVFHSTDKNLQIVFEHQTGAYTKIKTDRSFLHVSGHNQEVVEAYLAKLFDIPKVKTKPNEEPE